MESVLPVMPIPEKNAEKMSVHLFSCKSLALLCIFQNVTKGITGDLENKVDEKRSYKLDIIVKQWNTHLCLQD